MKKETPKITKIDRFWLDIIEEKNEAIRELLVGKTLLEVKQALLISDTKSRIVVLDGRPCIVTADWDPERLDLVVNKGIVTDIRF